MSTSTKTGTRPFWMIGLIVVGNPVAQVITSSPGLSGLRVIGEVSELTASRLADEPELQVMAKRKPRKLRKRSSKAVVKRPVVSQKSSEASTRLRTSSGPYTLPDTGTGEVPGTKDFRLCPISA